MPASRSKRTPARSSSRPRRCGRRPAPPAPHPRQPGCRPEVSTLPRGARGARDPRPRRSLTPSRTRASATRCAPRVRPAQDLWPELEQLDLRPRRTKACASSQPTTRTPPPDAAVARRIEHALVAQGCISSRPGADRNAGARPGGDHGAARAQRRLTDANLMRIAETPLPRTRRLPLCVALDRVVSSKARTHRAHPLHGECKRSRRWRPPAVSLRAHTDVQAITAMACRSTSAIARPDPPRRSR